MNCTAPNYCNVIKIVMVTIIVCTFFLAVLHDLWDLGSLTPTWVHSSESANS